MEAWQVEQDLPLSIIRGMDGVKYAFYLDEKARNILRNEESKVKGSTVMEAYNEGLWTALERECIICIVKTHFRPPPEPTVVLRADNGQILGEEVFPWTKKNYEGRDDIVWMFDGFVLFPKVEGKGKSRFIMPAVSFPELNESNGCTDVVSCSPSPSSDQALRTNVGLEVDTKMASILVGFNRVKGFRSDGARCAHTPDTIGQTRFSNDIRNCS